jgi:cation:H+ antiporter
MSLIIPVTGESTDPYVLPDSPASSGYAPHQFIRFSAIPIPVGMADFVLTAIIALLAGALLLFKGADFFVDGAEGLALHFNVSPTTIGLTVVAFGTSLPEFLVSMEATLTGSPGIAMGNVVGSNIANIGLILGLSVAIAPTIILVTPAHSELKRISYLMLSGTFLFALLSLRGMFDYISGIILLIGFAAVLALLWRGRTVLELRERPRGTRPILLTVGGLGMVVLGADLLLLGAEEIAVQFGIPSMVIGLSIVAIGTSLPELTTSLVAILRGSHGISIGNILGSNIFNILFILGSAALVGPIPSPSFVNTLVLIGFSLALLPFLFWHSSFVRIWGAGLCVLYILYLISVYAVMG